MTLNLSSNSRDGRDWAKQVVERTAENDGSVQAWDMKFLLENQGGRVIDLLKVDVEGSEVAIFGETAQLWLDKVRNICIELHGPKSVDRESGRHSPNQIPKSYCDFPAMYQQDVFSVYSL